MTGDARTNFDTLLHFSLFYGLFPLSFFSSFPSHLSFYSLVYLSYDFSCFPILPIYLFSFCLSFINNSFPKFVPSPPSPFCILPHHIISFSFPLIFLSCSINFTYPFIPLILLSLPSLFLLHSSVSSLILHLLHFFPPFSHFLPLNSPFLYFYYISSLSFSFPSFFSASTPLSIHHPFSLFL